MAGIHYGWWIALAAVLSTFVGVGVGRFALGMLLPAMGAALDLDYVQMGWISTANFIGYLLGALWVRRLLPRFGERRLIAISLLVVVASMAGVSLASGFWPLVILYTGTGVGSGIAFVCTVTLLPHWFASKYRGRAAGTLATGTGLAMMLAGGAIPLINQSMGAVGWRLGWGGLAAVCLPLALFCLLVVRNRPGDMALQPYGEGTGAAPGTANRAANRAARTQAAQEGSQHGSQHSPQVSIAAKAAERNLIMRLGAVYSLFGATYVVYATFVVTTLVREHGMAEAEAGLFWIGLGFFTLFCGPVLGGLSDRLGRRAGIIVSFLLQGSAYILIAYSSGIWGGAVGGGLGHEVAIYLSVFLFGLSVFGLPVIMTAAVADYLTPERTVAAISTLTVIFGIGQMLGPILAGFMAQYSGSFTPAYLAATALVAIAIAITLTLPDPPK
ncbi:MAG: YbfB/YjiJ family MFS transporter [Alphaproteobacteria bacterium]|nr:YbfB/YjiJ family MFS transporter [Alphaproteobacteria bacterium]